MHRRNLVVVVATLLLCSADFGQANTTGSVPGTITDASGAVVPNATVTVKNEATGTERRITTNDAGLFIVTKTSNAGSADVQDLRLRDGDVVWHRVALLAREWGEELFGERGLSSVGAVVGATFPRAVGEARRLLPQAVLLLPGVGAQGATPADVARAFTSGPASALVTVSRSVIYAFRVEGADWRTAAAAEAARLKEEVWAASGW